MYDFDNNKIIKNNLLYFMNSVVLKSIWFNFIINILIYVYVFIII